MANATYPLEYLRDFQFLVGNYSFLRIVRDSSDYSLYQSSRLLFENDDFDDYYPTIEKQMSQMAVPVMDSYQILGLEEINLLPSESPFSLQVSLDTKQQMNLQSISDSGLSSKLQQLPISSLEFDNAKSADYFISALGTGFQEIKRSLPVLKKLSLSVSSLRSLQAFSNVIDFPLLEHFELKLSRSTFNIEDEHLNLASLPFWNTALSENILSLSLVNLNYTNLLTNFSIGSTSVFKEVNLFYTLLLHCKIFNDPDASRNVTYVNFCLNSFAALPEFSMNPADYKSAFIVDDYYLKSKSRIFKKLFNFYNCETLIIPDYFFNWKPFIKLQTSSPDKGEFCVANSILDNTDYLFGYCNCPSCVSARKILLRKTEEEGAMGQTQTFYNFIVLLLFGRIPNMECRSQLNFFSNTLQDSVEILGSGYMKSDLAQVFHLILDNLVPDLRVFITRLPRLHELCLGGFLFDIDRSGTNSVSISAPQENWSVRI
ncbi:hypothetical protein FOA43_003421 [Brettanomyces nanus]|uniref:Uncharacterized protein n=1 Tax=Eeniella nana TaxID=13502 RepID=A0A875S6V5_EENNA|nr:uncharacterized protein FOA43_003421 [Brettanomyces nanus]QPG76035.1 hypothetical protein FOA43_003421 [Brettanomyces nanus]